MRGVPTLPRDCYGVCDKSIDQQTFAINKHKQITLDITTINLSPLCFVVRLAPSAAYTQVVGLLSSNSEDQTKLVLNLNKKEVRKYCLSSTIESTAYALQTHPDLVSIHKGGGIQDSCMPGSRNRQIFYLLRLKYRHKTTTFGEIVRGAGRQI